MNPRAALSSLSVHALPRLLAGVLLCLAAPCVSAQELHSYAFVEEDGTLRIRGTTVHLYGLHIPATGRHCNLRQRPIVCGSRAALALEFKIDGFVRCKVVERHADRSVTGHCTLDGEDLSAYLLERGWALALPDAPFEYQALEKIARHRNLGVWGFTVDNLPRRSGP